VDATACVTPAPPCRPPLYSRSNLLSRIKEPFSPIVDPDAKRPFTGQRWPSRVWRTGAADTNHSGEVMARRARAHRLIALGDAAPGGMRLLLSPHSHRVPHATLSRARPPSPSLTHRNNEDPLSDADLWAKISREPGIASPSLSLEDTSPPWSADAARPECGHYWRRPGTLSRLGTERIQSQCAALLKIT
jgi:hypothetical protein